VQIPLRFDPIDNNLIRTGYYYLPSKWQSKALPVMVLFHGLEGYGLDTIQAGSGSNFQVCMRASALGPCSMPNRPKFCCIRCSADHCLLLHARPRRLHWRIWQGRVPKSRLVSQLSGR